MDELYPGNKEILPVNIICVQTQKRYPTGAALDMRSQ